jgi:hypothetical protein
MVSMWDHWDDITFNNNVFAASLFDSLHPKGAHGYGAIAGGESAGKFSMVGNVFASAFFRNPLSYAASATSPTMFCTTRPTASVLARTRTT